MTGPFDKPMGDPMEGDEGLAAEYVLGTLPLEDRATAERRIARDPAFAALVAAWEGRLEGLNDSFAAVPAPPGVMDRVEARLFPAAARAPVPVPRRWWTTVLGGVAGLAVAVLAAIAFLPVAVIGPAPVTAELKGDGQALVVAASWDPGQGTLTVRQSAGGPAGAGRDYQLWLIPAGQAPVPLGLIRNGDLAVPVAALPGGTTLAVSLEPAGGSPTGQPTGPVLAAAVIPAA
jgi:anti-sigma-K factor RskA